MFDEPVNYFVLAISCVFLIKGNLNSRNKGRESTHSCVTQFNNNVIQFTVIQDIKIII